MAAGPVREDGGTAARILDVAERLVQVRGYNGFSYADIAAELQVTKAALHYHFAGKAELGEVLVTRYARRFTAGLAALDTRAPLAPGKLRGYAGLFLDVLRDQRMCLCGMLAAEYQTLPAAMRSLVVGFLDDNEAWLEAVLAQGRGEGSLQFSGSPRDAARMIVSCLEGAMLVARTDGDLERFQATAGRLLAGLTGPAPEDLPAEPEPEPEAAVAS